MNKRRAASSGPIATQWNTLPSPHHPLFATTKSHIQAGLVAKFESQFGKMLTTCRIFLQPAKWGLAGYMHAQAVTSSPARPVHICCSLNRMVCFRIANQSLHESSTVTPSFLLPHAIAARTNTESRTDTQRAAGQPAATKKWN